MFQVSLRIGGYRNDTARCLLLATRILIPVGFKMITDGMCDSSESIECP